MNIFAPLFFASIGLSINFAANFNFPLILAVFTLACLGKILGCTIGARMGGMQNNESLAVGFGMNSRGAMEIILGLLALQYGVIQEQLFVALVIMAIGTTMISGPMMEWILREKKPLSLKTLLEPETFIHALEGATRQEIIMELSRKAALATGIEDIRIYKEVWAREEIMGTALGSNIAVPHARLIEVKNPVVVAGICHEGIDFNAVDGEPARLIFLILTPARDQGAQLQILSDIATTFRDAETRHDAIHAEDYEEFMQALDRQTV
jgi:mannitol/fructose-specific phosphotransferase system IIA component (Ntr-type)